MSEGGSAGAAPGDEGLELLVRKHALANALRHGGRADPGAVLGKVLAERPDLRPRARELVALVGRICSEVSSMPPDEQARELESIAPGASEGRERAEEPRRALPPLPGAEPGRVVTRFAPNPDSVLHVGSARAAVLSHDYARAYGGKFILRFDDTDPRIKKSRLDLYDAVLEDLRWLGCEPDEVHRQSERLEIYYRYAEALIMMGGAYVDTCPPEEFRRLVRSSRPCPDRDLPPEVHLERWRRMLNGEYGEGEAVLRVKTDLSHPNPAVRDWPAFRIVDTGRHPHPVVGSRYRVWPLYNWASAVDDHEMGVTHIFRGQEHSTNAEKQRYVYARFGWTYPVAIHYGRLMIEGGVLSKSEVERGIREGRYTGYDDPRLATLRALRRRGVLPDAIRQLIYSVGIKPSDATVSWGVLLAINRKLIDPIAPRYFAVLDPVEVRISGVPGELRAEMPKHPQNPGMGRRSYSLAPEGGELRLLIERSDTASARPGSVIRMMGLLNARVTAASPAGLEAEFLPGGVEEARSARAAFVHWVHPQHSIRILVVMDDASRRAGLAESALSHERPGTIVQLEREFFARLDSVDPDGSLVLYYTSQRGSRWPRSMTAPQSWRSATSHGSNGGAPRYLSSLKASSEPSPATSFARRSASAGPTMLP
jgi:glutamyl-tRNA synthetase